MIISHKHKLVFLKTRRTAGSSIEAWLFFQLSADDSITGSADDGTPRLNCPAGITGHISSTRIRQLFPEITNEYVWFCVERNSYEKAVSDWLYHRDVIGDGYRRSFKDHLSITNVSDWGRYSKEKGIHIMPFELITKFLPLSTHLKKNNYTKPLSEYYDSTTRGMVEEMFKNEIRTFGYKMP